ncbi:hypothetical protein WJX77_001861 [Trebouxia sp. C0004]
MDFEEAVEVAKDFREHGGFVPQQNDLLNVESWRSERQGRFIGERQNLHSVRPHLFAVDVTNRLGSRLHASPIAFVVPPTATEAAAMLATSVVPRMPVVPPQPVTPAASQPVMPDTEPATDVAAPIRLILQLETDAGYVGGAESDPASDSGGELPLDARIAIRKRAFLPVVEGMLADLANNNEHVESDDSQLKTPINAMHRNWKTSLLGDHTHSVAEIVDASASNTLPVNHLIQARSFHAALLDKIKFQPSSVC